MMPTLTSCTACGNQIALTANTCPSCGAANTYVHPEVQRFLGLRQDNTLEGMPEFNFSHSPFTVNGQADTKATKRSFKFMNIGLWILFAALISLFLVPALFSLLVLVGTGISLLGHLLQGALPKYVTRFEADFSTGALVWRSDNEEFWAPVRRFFEQGNTCAPST